MYIVIVAIKWNQTYICALLPELYVHVYTITADYGQVG